MTKFFLKAGIAIISIPFVLGFVFGTYVQEKYSNYYENVRMTEKTDRLLPKYYRVDW